MFVGLNRFDRIRQGMKILTEFKTLALCGFCWSWQNIRRFIFNVDIYNFMNETSRVQHVIYKKCLIFLRHNVIKILNIRPNWKKQQKHGKSWITKHTDKIFSLTRIRHDKQSCKPSCTVSVLLNFTHKRLRSKHV